MTIRLQDLIQRISNTLGTIDGIIDTAQGDDFGLLQGLIDQLAELGLLPPDVASLDTFAAEETNAINGGLSEKPPSMKGIPAEDPIEVTLNLLKDDLTTMRDYLTMITGKMETVVGMVNETNGKVAVLSGQVASHSAKISELAGRVSALAGQVSALSAKVDSMQPKVIYRDLSSGEPPKSKP